MDATQSGRHLYGLPSWELGPKGGLLSRRVPATRPRPLAPSGMREEGMWSDAERATDILKRSRRPLLSFFLSSFFLPHATTCLPPFSNRSILPQLLFSCPVSAAAVCRSCPSRVSAAAARRPCPVRSCPRPPPCTVPVLSDLVLDRHRAPFLSCPILSSAAAARCSCPVRSCPRPPPRAVPVLSDPVLGRCCTPTSSLSHYPKLCRPGCYT